LAGQHWVIAPASVLAAAASGRRDALVYALGGPVGAAAYMATYPVWKSAGVLSGNALTLGAVPGAKYEALVPALPGDLAGIVVGAVLIAVAFALPEQIVSRPATAAAE